MSDSADNRPLTFPKRQRLTRSSEFGLVKAQGKVQRGRVLILGVLELSADTQPLRVGLVTSKRVGSAVVRNRVRRRLREIVRHHQHASRRGIWVVVIARRAAAAASYRDLEDEWLRLAKRASILRP